MFHRKGVFHWSSKPFREKTQLLYYDDFSRVDPFYDRQVTVSVRHISAFPPVPRTAVLSSPCKHVQVSSRCCRHGHVRIPRTSVLSSPFENVQASFHRRVGAHELVPIASVLSSPLETVQVSPLCCAHTRIHIPRAPVFVREL